MTLIKHATDIRYRAEIKTGEKLAEMEKAKGARGQLIGSKPGKRGKGKKGLSGGSKEATARQKQPQSSPILASPKPSPAVGSGLPRSRRRSARRRSSGPKRSSVSPRTNYDLLH